MQLRISLNGVRYLANMDNLQRFQLSGCFVTVVIPQRLKLPWSIKLDTTFDLSVAGSDEKRYFDGCSDTYLPVFAFHGSYEGFVLDWSQAVTELHSSSGYLTIVGCFSARHAVLYGVSKHHRHHESLEQLTTARNIVPLVLHPLSQASCERLELNRQTSPLQVAVSIARHPPGFALCSLSTPHCLHQRTKSSHSWKLIPPPHTANSPIHGTNIPLIPQKNTIHTNTHPAAQPPPHHQEPKSVLEHLSRPHTDTNPRM